MATPAPEAHVEHVTVNRVRVTSINIYDVKDDELDILERGSPADAQFNLAVAAITFAISTYVTLRSGTFTESDRLVAICLVAIAFLFGLYCFVMWFQNRSRNKSVCAAIRTRKQVTAPLKSAEPSAPVALDSDEVFPKG